MRMLQLLLPDPVSRVHLPDFFLYSTSDTTHELRSFIDRYREDYTRGSTVPAANEPSSSGASVERGRGVNRGDEEESGFYTPVPSGAHFRQGHHGIRVVEGSPSSPGRPMRVYPPRDSGQGRDYRRNGFVGHQNMPSIHRDMRLSEASDVPTSERTYGDTNRLLGITVPTPNDLPMPSGPLPWDRDRTHRQVGILTPIGGRSELPGIPPFDPEVDPSGGVTPPDEMVWPPGMYPRTRTRNANVELDNSHNHVFEDRTTPSADAEWFSHDNQENTPPHDGDDEYMSDLPGVPVGPPGPPPAIRTGSVVLSPSLIQVYSNRPPSLEAEFRTSSIYPESGWQTERSESPGLTASEDLDEYGDRYSHSPESASQAPTSPGLTVSQDEDENGNRYSHSPESRNESRGLPPSQDQDDDSLFALPLDSHRVAGRRMREGDISFPDLQNPVSELSPQRERPGRLNRSEENLFYGFDQTSPGRPPIRSRAPSPESPRRPPTRSRAPSPESPPPTSHLRVGLMLLGDYGPPRGPVPYEPAKTNTMYYPKYPRTFIDYEKPPAGDVKRALSIIIRKYDNENFNDYVENIRDRLPGAHAGVSKLELDELDAIRVRNGDAIAEASARLFQQRSFTNLANPAPSKVLSPTTNPPQSVRSPFTRRQDRYRDYDATKSFDKAAGNSLHNVPSGSLASFDSRAPLLSVRNAAANERPLAYSETERTFTTTRGADIYAPNDGELWDPHSSSPTDRVLQGGISRGGRYPATTPSKLRPICNSGRFKQPAVGGQHELRRLQLPDKQKEINRKTLTDEEMMQREQDGKWNLEPAEQIAEAKMLQHRLEMEQKGISLKYVNLSAIIPFGPLVYGLGGADWIINQNTSGRIKTMGHKQKRSALVTYFPLQMLGYTIVALVVGILVYMHFRVKGGGGGEKSLGDFTDV